MLSAHEHGGMYRIYCVFVGVLCVHTLPVEWYLKRKRYIIFPVCVSVFQLFLCKCAVQLLIINNPRPHVRKCFAMLLFGTSPYRVVLF